MLQWLLTQTPLLYFTQSLWRDEAFSILTAQKSVSEIIGKLGLEPPLYYLLLHFWLKLFGTSEIAARSLSLVGLGLATLVVIIWAEKIFKKHWLTWFLPLFFFLNPMLLYYGFEVRSYAWYVFFALLSMYGYLEKRWWLYVGSTVLGFYTHSFMLIFFFATFCHWFLTQKIWQKLTKRPKLLINNPFCQSLVIILLLMAPWLWRVITRSANFADTWYFPVDIQLVKSVLGNMFLGYEGTPWFLWKYTKFLSLVLLVFFLWSLKSSRSRGRNLFFFFMIFVPLIVVIGISFVKPLFVNRYLIPVVIAEIFLLLFFLETISSALLRKLLAIGYLFLVIGFNFWYPAQHPKVDVRRAIQEVNLIKDKDDLIYAESPLVLFETLYYSSSKDQVYLYNPHNSPFPWYLGEGIFSPRQNAASFPNYPVRAFIIHENGTFSVAYHMPVTQFSPAPKRTL